MGEQPLQPRKGQDPRSLSLYGQEKELDTWAIAQINLFLHDIDDAFIAKGDTILDPKRYDPRAQEFVPGIGAYDRVLANPPFSAKEWGHELWTNGDPFGWDRYGIPPRTKGDFAFIQHMLARMLAAWELVRAQAVSFMEGTSGRQRVPSWAFYRQRVPSWAFYLIEVPVPPLGEQLVLGRRFEAIQGLIASEQKLVGETDRINASRLYRVMQAMISRFLLEPDGT